MAVNTSAAVTMLPFSSQADVRLPLGTWYAEIQGTGDGTGGRLRVSATFGAGLVFSVAQLSVRRDGAGASSINITAALDGFTAISSAPGISQFFSISSPPPEDTADDTGGHVSDFVSSELVLGQANASASIFADRANAASASLWLNAWGYYYDPSAQYQPGGPNADPVKVAASAQAQGPGVGPQYAPQNNPGAAAVALSQTPPIVVAQSGIPTVQTLGVAGAAMTPANAQTQIDSILNGTGTNADPLTQAQNMRNLSAALQASDPTTASALMTAAGDVIQKSQATAAASLAAAAESAGVTSGASIAAHNRAAAFDNLYAAAFGPRS